jgi:hypothetical protein
VESRRVENSVAEPHQHDAAPALDNNFDVAPATPTIYQVNSFKTNKRQRKGCVSVFY